MIKTRHFEEFNQKTATAGSNDRDHKKNNSVTNKTSSENSNTEIKQTEIKPTDNKPVEKKTLKRPKMGFTIADLSQGFEKKMLISVPKRAFQKSTLQWAFFHAFSADFKRFSSFFMRDS